MKLNLYHRICELFKITLGKYGKRKKSKILILNSIVLKT